jgi:hypothetical protein
MTALGMFASLNDLLALLVATASGLTAITNPRLWQKSMAQQLWRRIR